MKTGWTANDIKFTSSSNAQIFYFNENKLKFQEEDLM